MSSKSQAKKGQSSGSKSKKPRNTFKNVMVQPFPRYWPQLSEEHTNLLMSLLDAAREENPKLFDTKKSEERKPITYGLSSCISRIKSGSIGVLIISADLKPRYVVNQIILLTLARNKSASIFCITGLGNWLSEIIPFSCFSVAIDAVDDSSALKPILNWCESTISAHHPVPEQILRHFARRHEIQTHDSDEEAKKNDKTTDVEMFDVSFENLYLTKPSGENQRAFIPNNLTSQTLKMEKDQDFISLENTQSISSIAGVSTSTTQAEIVPKNRPLSDELKAAEAQDIKLLKAMRKKEKKMKYLERWGTKNQPNFSDEPERAIFMGKKKKRPKEEREVIVGLNEAKLIWGDTYYDLQVNKTQGKKNYDPKVNKTQGKRNKFI